MNCWWIQPALPTWLGALLPPCEGPSDLAWSIRVEKRTFIDPCQSCGAHSKNLMGGLGSTAGGIKSRSRSSHGYIVIPKKLLGIS